MRLAHLTAMTALAAASPFVCFADPGAPPPEPAPPPSPPPSPEPATAEKIHLVWAAPGHPTYAIGMMVRVDGDLGEQLRAGGHARYADADEVKAHKKAKRDIHEFG